MTRTLWLLIVVTLCVGCATSALTTLQMSPNEAAVIGHIRIAFNGEDVTDGSTVLFNERAWGTYAYKVPSDGWIITKLPLGDSSIARIGFARFMRGNFFYDFTPEQTGFNLAAGQQIYYIGDIVVDWSGRGFKPSMLFGLAGAIVDQMSSDGTLKMAVNDNRYVATQELARRFGSGSQLASSLVGKPRTASTLYSAPPSQVNAPAPRPPSQPSSAPVLVPPPGN